MAESRLALWDASVRPSARRAASVVLVLALLSSLSGLGLAPVLLSHTRGEDFEAPKDSPSRLAREQLQSTFPLLAKTLPAQIVIIVRALDGYPTVLTQATEAWSQRLLDVVDFDERVTPFRPLVAGYYTGATQLGLPPQDPYLRSALVATDNRTTLLVLLAGAEPPRNSTYTPWAYKFWLMGFLRQYCGSPPPGTQVVLAGNFVTYFDQLRGQGLETVLMWAELRVVPMTLVVLAFLVREVRLLVLPPITLCCTLLTVASALVPVALLVPISSDLPPSIVSVVIALSMDCSLFMLARFNENRAHNMTLQENVDVVLSHTGHTISLSGLLIAMAYFGAMSVPQDNLRYAGLALGVSTVVTVAVNVALMPSLLLLAGHLLARSPAPVASGGGLSRKHSSALDDGTPLTTRAHESAVSRAGVSRRVFLQKRGGWVWLMRNVEQRPVTAVFALFLLFLPVLVELPRLNASADAYMALPMRIGSVDALRSLEADFIVGRFDPYVVMVVADETVGRKGSFKQTGGHAALLELASALWELRGIGSMLGPVWLVDERVDWEQAHDLPPKIRGLYRKVVNTHVSADGMASALQVHTTLLPRGLASAPWVRSVRSLLAAWELRHPGYRASLAGGATEAFDSRAAVMDAMPRYLGAVLLGVMAVIFAMFGSLLLPFRLALAILFTLSATFGVVVLVYQTPLLHGIWPWLANYEGVCYEVIPMASCVAVALGIDYDIFLISRVVEYRMLGLSDSTSITEGVARTGGIITGAGIIMSLAFSGLFFSEKLFHQQIALTLVTSVLLDTFVVRTVLVPALMFIAKSMNWWPRAVPDCDDGSCNELIVEFELTPGVTRSRTGYDSDADGGYSS